MVIWRRRLVALAAVVLVVVAVVGVVRLSTGSAGDATPLVPRDPLPSEDVLAYDDEQAEELERAAAFGLSHPLYTKSPGGVFASARRTAALRPLVDGAVDGTGFDADAIEAIVFLESGGRPDVIAGDDPARASGLTQILAETAQNFLGMDVDLAASRRLTAAIARARQRGDTARTQQLLERRRRIDARFDPEQALAGTVRYLLTARERLGRDDLAVVSYHMGIGNLTNVLRAYVGDETSAIPELVDENDLSWVRVFFDTAPDTRSAAYALLSRLGDDSPTYFWRVLAGREIMRLYRDDPDRLRELDLLHNAKASAEEVLHPPAETERFAEPEDLARAWESHALNSVPNDPDRLGFSVDRTMGELAPLLGRQAELYRGLRREALAVLVYMAGRVRALSGAERPLAVTSAVRDETYQELLRTRNVEATRGYSLHTTGYAFDIRRRYESGRQSRAFQFVLDRLTARGLIAWVREPAAIHVTVASDAARLVPELLEPARS